MLFLVRHLSTYAGGSGCRKAVARSSAKPDLGLCKATRMCTKVERHVRAATRREVMLYPCLSYLLLMRPTALKAFRVIQPSLASVGQVRGLGRFDSRTPVQKS